MHNVVSTYEAEGEPFPSLSDLAGEVAAVLAPVRIVMTCSGKLSSESDKYCTVICSCPLSNELKAVQYCQLD